MSIPVMCKLSASSASDLEAIDRDANRPPWSAALFASEFTNGYATVYGARFQGQLVGFLVSHRALDESHIVNFAIRRDFRKRGIGRELMTSALVDLHEQGVRWATLEVRISNAAARALYDSFGFIEVALRERYYTDDGEDGIVMTLNIPQFIAQLSDGGSSAANE